ncbi:lactosylceramide 4-alpha-galactosyltransferase-like [Cloeon dipterum]|uniref:lactosylceramide 4-alpha-galactosyltransferase-like n=1 Tax=Cloeon dipterum TaxID=197152 RepID=UPI0032200CFB
MVFLRHTFLPCLRISTVVLFFCCVYCAFYCFSSNQDQSGLVLTDLGRMLGDLNAFDATFGRRQVVFFVETSNSGKVLERHVCSLEAAASLNPNVTVLLVMTQQTSQIRRENNTALVRLLDEYPNIRLACVESKQLLKNTVLEEIWTTKFLHSVAPVQHLSDLVRLALLWHFGGVYMDLDVLTVRNLSLVLREANLLAADDADHLNSCVMGFERRHPLLQTLLEVVRAEYDPKSYSTVPTAINSAVVAYFNLSVEEAVKLRKWQGVRFYNSNSFSPFKYAKYLNLFYPTSINWADRISRSSYGVHFWGSHTNNILFKENSTAPFVQLARKFCPKTYPSLYT